MRKSIRRIWLCVLITAAVWTAELLTDRQMLNEALIRFHVVANSDAQEDQAIKLQVRDAVLEGLQRDLQQITDVEAARAYLQENLPKIQRIAKDTLQAAGVEMDAVVTLCQEAFTTRQYDTFSLPAGVYESLKITIGDGSGKNWWCVAFPTLCLSATTEGFADTAVEAGFSEALTETLSGDDACQIRFFLLDVIGKWENILFE